MAKNSFRILILEENSAFQDLLGIICQEIGKTAVVSDVPTALDVLTQEPFDLVLLSGTLPAHELAAVNSTLKDFQPHAQRLALFTNPDLMGVIEAMKNGAQDILWAAMPREVLKTKLKETLHHAPKPAPNNSLSKLADTLTEKSLVQKTSFIKARREFSRIFLKQVLWQQKLKRTQLAGLMQISPRTLHRHLSA